MDKYQEEIDLIIEMSISIFQKYKLNEFDIPKGGITEIDGEDSFFELTQPIQAGHIIPNSSKREFIKRVAVAYSDIIRITKNDNLEKFISELGKNFTKETGCINFTFKRDDGTYMKRLKTNYGVELRIYGYKQKGE